MECEIINLFFYVLTCCKPLSGVTHRGRGEVQESHGIECTAGQRQSQPHLSSGHTQGCHRGDGGANVRDEEGAGRKVEGDKSPVW